MFASPPSLFTDLLPIVFRLHPSGVSTSGGNRRFVAAAVLSMYCQLVSQSKIKFAVESILK